MDTVLTTYLYYYFLELGVVDPPSPEPSGWRMPLFLVISIPLIAGLFFVVIIIFCWRYHKKVKRIIVHHCGFNLSFVLKNPFEDDRFTS